jgi:outer membrane protein assembly factor BamC
MQTRIVRLFLGGSLLLVTTGCESIFGNEGVFRDRSEDYKKAPQTAPVSVPEGMESAPLRDIYVVPPVEEGFLERGEFEVPRPAPLSSSVGQEVVRIQKLGDASWILIGVAPGQVWPQVRNFMSASGMQIARANARAGIMESNWLTLENESLASRFQFRMEQGVQRGTSELHVLQMTQGGSSEEWPAKSDDPVQGNEMLQAVAQFLADSAESAPVSMLAEQGISAGGKITLQEGPEGHAFLRLELPFDRAWASVGRALQKSSFEITDKDRSSGSYYVRFQKEALEDEQGLWSRLWQSDDKQPPADQIFLVSMQSLEEQAVNISLKPQDSGVPFDKREEQEMLITIKGNIN